MSFTVNYFHECPFCFICEICSPRKEAPYSIRLQAGDDGKLINSEKAVCCMTREELVLVVDGKTSQIWISLEASIVRKKDEHIYVRAKL